MLSACRAAPRPRHPPPSPETHCSGRWGNSHPPPGCGPASLPAHTQVGSGGTCLHCRLRESQGVAGGVPAPSSHHCGSQGNIAPCWTREVLSTGVDGSLWPFWATLCHLPSLPQDPAWYQGHQRPPASFLGGKVKDREAPHLRIQPQPSHRTPRHSCLPARWPMPGTGPPTRPLGCRPHHTESPRSTVCPPEACSRPRSRPGCIPEAGLGPGTPQVCTALTRRPCHTRSPGSC